MVDTELLEQKIIESGKKIGYLAEKLRISRQYFRAYPPTEPLRLL